RLAPQPGVAEAGPKPLTERSASALGSVLLPSIRLVGEQRCDPPQLTVDVVTLVERQPAPKPARLTARAIREDGVGVQARTRRVAPGAPAVLPGRDHPALAVVGPAGGERRPEALVL